MKRVFPIIIVLITVSLIGTIIIQYSWLKNVILIRKEQVAGKVEMVEFEVVEALVEEKMRYAPDLPDDVLPKGSREQLLKLLGPETIAEHFTVEQIQERLRKSFEENGLKGAKFEFAVLSSENDFGPELASPGYEMHYELGQKDTSNYWIHVWPLVSLGSEEEVVDLAPQEKLVLVIYDMQDFVIKSVTWTIIAAIFFTLVIIAAFYVTVRTLLNQKKLSEMKTDFINNMTHELRTPLATIAIAVDTMKNEKVIASKEQLGQIRQIIKAENSRMNIQVEQILQAAQLDVNQVLKDKEPLHVHEVLERIKEKFSLQLSEKNGSLTMKLHAEQDLVSGHPVHFVNMISNLVDNAIKYAKEDVDPYIEISTRNGKNKIIIEVKDNGIGMTKDTLSKVFDKFYRAHTGNRHDVKGFGLGLNYSKKMAEAHMGSIAAESTPGKGSMFTLVIPLI